MPTAYTLDGEEDGGGDDAGAINAISAATATATTTSTTRYDDDGLMLDAAPLPPPLPTMITTTTTTTNNTNTTTNKDVVVGKRHENRKYHAVRVGRCSLSSSSFVSSSSPPPGRQRDVVAIRNAIFVRWEDAREFVECDHRGEDDDGGDNDIANRTNNDEKVEYSSFDTLEDAERYLLMVGGGRTAGEAGTTIEDGKGGAGGSRRDVGGDGAKADNVDEITPRLAGGMTTNDGSSEMRDVAVLLAEENERLRRRGEELLFASGASRDRPSIVAAAPIATANGDRATMTNATNNGGTTNNAYLEGENERLRRRAEDLAAFACAVMSRAGGAGLVGGVGGLVGGEGDGGINEAHSAAVYRYWSEKMAAAEAISGMNANAVSFFGRQHHLNDAFASTMMKNALVDVNAVATIGQTPPGAKSRRNGRTTGNDGAVVGNGDDLVSSSQLKKTRKRKANDEGDDSPDSMTVEGSADPPPSSKKKSKKRADIWFEMFKSLEQYKEANGGSIDIPHSPPDSEATPEAKRLDKLRKWCENQLHHQRRCSLGYEESGNLTAERIEKLRDVGLALAPSYDEMYERLASRAAGSNITGPLVLDEENDAELFAWVEEQKRMLKKYSTGKSHPLSDDRIRKLILLGYSGAPSPTSTRRSRDDVPDSDGTSNKDAKWDAMFAALVKYKEERGTLIFPNDHKSLPKHEQKVKWWIGQQRQQFRELQRGKTSTLTAQRLQRLHSLGLELAPRNTVVSWAERMKSLREFAEQHGHCKPKKGHPLYSFVSNVRHFYTEKEEGRKSCLTDERVNDLIEIGFVFRAGKTPNWTTTERKSWEDRYQELLAFKEEHGHTLISQKSGGPLGVWVKEQRTGYRKMKQGEKTHMTAEKALMLKEIGFHFDATMFRGPNGALKEIASTF